MRGKLRPTLVFLFYLTTFFCSNGMESLKKIGVAFCAVVLKTMEEDKNKRKFKHETRSLAAPAAWQSGAGTDGCKKAHCMLARVRGLRNVAKREEKKSILTCLFPPL
jgi:hypothetical protein